MLAKQRKVLSFATIMLLVVVATFCFMPTTVHAETVTQYGITVDLATDKTDYVSGDMVNILVRITNTNQMNMEDVSLALTLPDGLGLQSGATSISTGALASGEMKEFSLVAIVNNNSNPTSDPAAAPTVQVAATEPAPQTGDDSSLVLFIVLALAAAVLLVLAIRYRKKLKGLFSLLLCLTLLGSALAFVPVEVNAQATGSAYPIDDALPSIISGGGVPADMSLSQTSGNHFKISVSPEPSHHSICVNGVETVMVCKVAATTEDFTLGSLTFAQTEYHAYINNWMPHPLAVGTVDAADQPITYSVSTSDESILRLDGQGNMEGLQEGEVTLTASVTGTSGASYSTTTQIKVVILGGIDVLPDPVFLNKSTGEVVALTATSWGSFAGKAITWTSSDPAAIVVDESGNAFATVNAIATSTYSIFATAKNDNGDTATGAYIVNIVEATP